MSSWAAPVLRMFLGELSPDAVIAAADDPSPVLKRWHLCDAYFYSGTLALVKGASEEAARRFRLAARDCPKQSIDFVDANAERKALGMTA